jgi:hypothetical protein
MAREPSGVFSLGFTIITFPVARAGAALRKKVARGALKGLMATVTPSGSCRTSFTNPRTTLCELRRKELN